MYTHTNICSNDNSQQGWVTLRAAIAVTAGMYTVIDSSLRQSWTHGWFRGIYVNGTASQERYNIGITSGVSCLEGIVNLSKSIYTSGLIDIELDKHTAQFNISCLMIILLQG